MTWANATHVYAGIKVDYDLGAQAAQAAQAARAAQAAQAVIKKVADAYTTSGIPAQKGREDVKRLPRWLGRA